MSNPPNMIEKALAAAGLPPMDELAEEYAMLCHAQFKSLFCGWVSLPVATAVAFRALGFLTATLLLTMEVLYPGRNSIEEGLEAFIVDLREMVKRGPHTMEEVERREAEMGIEP